MQTTEQTDKNKWIWIGLAAAMVFCLCACAAAFFVFFKVGERVQEGFSTDHESVVETAHQIADYELPRGYTEQTSFDFFFYTFVMITPDTNGSLGEPVIMLAQFTTNATNQEQMTEEIRRSFEQQSGNPNVRLELKEIKKMTIRGEETEVAIYEGVDASGTSMRQLITTFPGKDGTAMLIIMGSPQYWNDQTVNDFIESIH